MVSPVKGDSVEINGDPIDLDATEDGIPPHSVCVVCADYITPYINSRNAEGFTAYNSNSLSLCVESNEEISQNESCMIKIQDGSDLRIQIRD
jgi:hypothetical protein